MLKDKLKMNLQYFAEKEPEAEDQKEPEVDKTDEGKENEPEVVADDSISRDKIANSMKDDSEPTPKAEEPEDPKPEGTSEEDLERLKAKLKEAEAYKEQYESAIKYKDEYEKAKQELEGYETSLQKIADERIEQVPEEFRELIPEGTTQEKLDWLSKADKAGLFTKKEEKSIGSSIRVNDKASKEVKYEDMTTNQKLVAGIKERLSNAL